VLGARHYEQRSSEPDQRAVHAMFSPPQADLQNSNAVEGWRAKATEIAEEHGIRSGMCVFHGFRVQPKVSQKFKSLIEGTEFDETATDVLLWEWIRRDDWRKYATWGPHFHIVGLAREDEDAVDEYKGEGVFQRLREFDAYETSNNMTAVAEHRSVAKDIMDHASFKNSDALPPISWFGDLEGQSWSSAKQYVTDSKLNSLRGKLINGPAKVE